MDDWIRSLLSCRRQALAAVLVTVASTRESVPRAAGTRMVVTASGEHGSIGGGNLELQAISIAKSLLEADDYAGIGALRRFPLGASLGQCCGGLVNLMFEAVAPSASQAAWLDEIAEIRHRGETGVLVSAAGAPAASGSLVVTAGNCSGSLGDAQTDLAAAQSARQMLADDPVSTRLVSLTPQGLLFLFDVIRPLDFEVVLFGAGHVGQALARILGALPCRLTWVDERPERFCGPMADNIQVEISDEPLAEVDAAVAGSYFLVMTHSHALDQTLSEAILRRGDFNYFGLIGSTTKRRQFERRLTARGMTAQTLTRMTCPIGIDGIDGKEPATIAVAVAAQLLREHARSARQLHAVPAGGFAGAVAGSIATVAPGSQLMLQR